MPRRRKTADAAVGDRRREILDCAAELFAERGYAHTTTRELAECAGVSEGLIFHHFGNKMGLFRALTMESRPEHMAVALAHARTAPLAELPALLGKAWIGDAREASLLVGLTRDAEHDPELRELVAEVVESVLAGIAAVLRARVDAGELRRDLDVGLASEIVQQVLLGHSLRMSIVGPRSSLTSQLALVFAGFRA